MPDPAPQSPEPTPPETKPGTWLIDRAKALFNTARPRTEPRDFDPALAVFGKHPAFGSEHLEAGLGPGVSSCVALKSRIYNRCIEPLLPRWQAFPDDQRLARFDHLLLYLDPLGGAVLGRLIERSDSVGRTGFPTVLLVYLPVHSPESLRSAGTALERFERRLAQCITPEQVVDAADQSQRHLETILAPSASTRIDLPSTRRLLRSNPPGHRRYDIPDHAPLLDMLRIAQEVRRETNSETLVIAPRARPWADAIHGEFGPEHFLPVMLLRVPVPSPEDAPPQPIDLWPDEPEGTNPDPRGADETRRA